MEQESQALDLSSMILEDENQNNIKLGDIIYLKSYLPDENKGLISGEGFGTNKLECLLLQKISNQQLAYKQAELNIYRCLFRIIDNNYSTDQIPSQNKKEANENNQDQQESEANVVYGQEIQLLHLYSKCFLCLNSQVLAKENCCRELKLENNITQNSCFMFQSNTKNSGEPVLYGDILLLKSSVPHLNQWGLGVQQNEPFSEVHASQIPSTLRVCSYYENMDALNIIINGDIIIFKNRYFGGFLSVSRKASSTKLLSNRQLVRNDKKVYQKFLDTQVFKNQQKLEGLFHFNLENEIKPNSMWLLLGINVEQHQQNRKEYIKQKKSYLIKHILTGAFLCIQNDVLNLTYDIITEKCEFYIRNQQKIDQSIFVGEFYRIISKTFAVVIQCEDNNEVGVSQKSSKIQFDQQLFQLKRGPFDEAMTANKIQSFYFEIIEFYQYLQEWGLDTDKCYSYVIAFKQQKQLQDEINQFAKLIQNIHSFLSSSDEISLKQTNQYYLCNSDILDLLFALQQLICQITYQENSFYSTMQDKTASRIARQKFDPISNLSKKKQFNLVDELYQLIYQIIFDNVKCCDYIIEQDNIIDFLVSQLHYYKEIIEKILKQLVSKAKYNPAVANKWLNRVKSITETNLEDQIFIVKIINLLISSQYHISVECQNLCRKKLFVNNKSKLIRCLIKNDDQPVIHFEGNEANFLEINSKICEAHQIIYPRGPQNQIFLEFFAKFDIEKLFFGYEQYILGVLNLFASMCKGRNYKNMNLIKQVIGINPIFFEKVNQIKHSLMCKQIMIDLYSSLYFDIDPLAKISTFENTCYLRQELKDFSLDTESGIFFYENISSRNIKTTDIYSSFKLSTLHLQENTLEFLNLKQFTKHIIHTQKFHQQFVQLFLQEQYPDSLIEDSNMHLSYKQIAKTQLNFFLSLVMMIKNSVELGYNNLPVNLAIQSQLPFIFIALMIQQKNKFKTFEFQEEFAFQRNMEKLRNSTRPFLKQYNEQFDFIHGNSWITEFLIWSTSICNDVDLIESIFQESLNIYKVFFYLQENLQILYYITNKSFKSENLFIDHNSLLFHCLFGQSKLPRLNLEILNYLVLSFNQQHQELQEIKEVEILDDEIELKYFSIVNGHTQVKDGIGPKEIQVHIKKALRFVSKNKDKNGKDKENESSFKCVQKYLEDINKLFEELQNHNSSYLHSLQNMIRNASIHLLFVDFFLNPESVVENGQVVYLYRSLLKFWENFIKDNQTNFSIILPYLEELFQIILIPQPDAFHFTYQSLQLSKLELWKASTSILDLLMSISKNLDFKNNLIHIRAGKQYLKILRGITKTSTKPHFNILSNQKQILHLLLQFFRNLIDPINYFGEIETISKEKNQQLDILRYQQLKLHSTALNLIADSCQNYFLGIQEMQRILLFETLVTILQNGPYVVKAAYLRCIFELYINQVKQNSQINDLIDNQQIKELLNLTIIPDLQLMQQFQTNTMIQSTIMVSNNEYWKYVLYIMKFLVSMMDEFRVLERFKQIDFFQEFQTIQILLQGMLLINSRQIIRNNKDEILQIVKLIKEFTDNKCNFNVYSRLLIYCVRMEIQFSDLIKHVESLKIKDNLEKLKEICNQNGKNYLQADDFSRLRKISSRIDIPLYTEEWTEFKSQFSSFHELREITAFTERRQNDEQNLSDLKEQFALKKEENVKKRLTLLKLNFQIDDYLSEDVQLFLFLNNLLKQNNSLLQIERIKDFLIECKQIFSSHPQYLIKLCRVLFEMKKPVQQIFDSSQYNNGLDQFQEQLEEYVQYQNIISDSEIDLLALEQLNSQSMKLQLDALTFLQHLLDFGNSQVQLRLYQILKIKKKRKNFVQFFKDFYSIDVSTQIEAMRMKDTTIYEQLCIKVLQVLQGLCENVHLEFQRFLRIQNESDSITNNFNFIQETTNLLVNFLGDTTIEESEKMDLYQQGMLSLIEFSTGLGENRREITKNSRLFQSFNKLFDEQITDDVLIPSEKNGKQDNYKLLSSLSIYIKLLISLLDGNIEENRQVYKFLYECVDISFLLQLAKKIYHLRIIPKKNNICVDRCCKNPCNQRFCNQSFCIFGFKTKEDSLLIETGLSIFVIGLKLSALALNEKYDIFKFEAATYEQQLIQENQEFLSQSEEIGYEKTFSLSQRPKFFQTVYAEVSTDEFRESLDEVEEKEPEKQSVPVSISRKDEFFQFFREYIGRIEVVNQSGKIERILFQKPFVCKYMTPNIEQHLIYESNRETDEDRIASLLENVNFYHSQMIHYQKISTLPIMHFGQKHWRKLKDISYILCVFIVIFFIIWPKDIEEGNLYTGDDENSQTPKQESKSASVVLVINNIITIIQLVLNLIIIIFCAVERYPIAINYRRSETNIKLIQNLKREAGFIIPEYKMKYYDALGYLENNFDQKQAQKNPLRKIILLLILDFDNFYNVVVFGITIIAFVYTSVYCILLLDIIKRSEVLQYIIKAFTENTQNLIVFGLLGLIGLVQFGFIINASLSEDFKDEQAFAKDSLGYAIAQVVNLGLRNGGGIGDALNDYPNPFEEPSKYWKRYFYDLSFFIIFNMIFIQMIFGIIVDKFGELRDQRSDLLKDIEGKCFICSLDRNVIDSKTKNGWYFHIYLEHNVYHMLYYLIYIKMKPITECNKLEKYIKDQIENKQSDFFPVETTLELQNEENKE